MMTFVMQDSRSGTSFLSLPFSGEGGWPKPSREKWSHRVGGDHERKYSPRSCRTAERQKKASCRARSFVGSVMGRGSSWVVDGQPTSEISFRPSYDGSSFGKIRRDDSANLTKKDRRTHYVGCNPSRWKQVQYEIVIDLSKAASRPTSSFVSQMRAQVLPKVCNSEIVQFLILGASYEYVYRDEKSNDLGSLIISNSDCH
jgi:hypothetical protein